MVPMYPVSHLHAATVALPLSETEAVGHVRQTAPDSAPTLVEYRSAAHNVQFDVSGLVLYVPAEHARHAAPVWPGLLRGQKPALHVQFVMAALPTGAHESARHDVHCSAPSGEYVFAAHTRQFSVVVPPTEYRPAPHDEHASVLPKLNFPAPHATHVLLGVLSLAVENPALHLQASIETLPLAYVVEFPTHAPHAATDVREVAAWCVPIGQFVHAASPSVSLYVPTPQ
jgi:hypothetical protein